MRLLLLLLTVLLFILSSPLDAQISDDELRSSRRNTVIAPSGLNLRNSPGIDGKVIARVPYGTQLELVDRRYHGREAVNPNRTLEPYAWAHVRHNGQTGFLYDAYLAYDYFVTGENDFPADVNVEFVMAQRGVFRLRVIPDFTTYTWYGIYHLGSDKIMAIRKVEPEMRYGSAEVSGGLFLTLGGDPEDDPLFFIGSRQPLPTGLLDGFLSNRFGQPVAAEGKTNYAQLKDLGVVITLVSQPKIYAPRKQLRIRTDGTSHPYRLPLNGTPLGLQLIADLNGDGQPDYLIHGHVDGQDVVNESVLFLSQPAGATKPLRAVALWTSF